jgi:hypothetical protein
VLKEDLSDGRSSLGADQALQSTRGDGSLTCDDLAAEPVAGKAAADGTGGKGCAERDMTVSKSF